MSLHVGIVINFLDIKVGCSSRGHRFTGAGAGAAGNRHCSEAVSNAHMRLKMNSNNRCSKENLTKSNFYKTWQEKIKTTDPLQVQLVRQAKLKVTAAGFFVASVSRQQVKEEVHEWCTGTWQWCGCFVQRLQIIVVGVKVVDLIQATASAPFSCISHVADAVRVWSHARSDVCVVAIWREFPWTLLENSL